jgi:hypothetical protein
MNDMLIDFKDLFAASNSDELIQQIKKLHTVNKLNKSFCYFLLNIFLITISKYKKNSLIMCTDVVKHFFLCNEVLQEEFISNLNQIKHVDDKNINNVISITYTFFKLFNEKRTLKVAINIIHEVIFNIIRLDKSIDPNVKCNIYVVFMKELHTSIIEEKLRGGDIYIKTIEICNITVKLINEWIDD